MWCAMMALSGPEEAWESSNPDSHNRLTRHPAPSASLNCASQALHNRQRTDTLPSRFRKKRIAISSSEVPRLPKLQCCSICLEIMDSSLWICPSYLCAHEPKICESCIETYIIHAINNRFNEILCPDVECRKEIGYEDILVHTHEDEECLNRYNALVAQRELERQPNFVWCTNPWCRQGQIHDGGATIPLVICDYCHERTCFVHHTPWHSNLTCDQYSKYEENEASEEYIRIYMKRCPNTECKRPVEKIDGCDHMTCHRPGGCGHQFCWICLADYTSIRREGNHKHNPDCRHFVPITPNSDPDAIRSTPWVACFGVRCFGPGEFMVIDRDDECEPPPAQARAARATRQNTLIPPGPIAPSYLPLSPPLFPQAQGPLNDPPEPNSPPASVFVSTTSFSLRPGAALGAEPSGSRPRPEISSLPHRAGARSGSSGAAHTIRPGPQEPIPAPVRNRMRRCYMAPEQTSSLPRRIGTPGPSSTQQTSPHSWRSELYRLPPLPQYIPQIGQSEYPEPPTPPRRSTQGVQAAPQAPQAAPSLDEIRERLLHMMRRRQPNQEERQPSSIPDFESEVVLYRVPGR
ncbi:hypothetical protein B0J17DRAFT_684276 [Rhizoctonia solani]|nr:hypothetical protein B0J17DRAFT_684276 [Rhizoctonia solani]